MLTLKVYNREGNVSGEMELPKKLQAAWNPTLVHQVAQVMIANSRQNIAHTKHRGEVSGGGKKPWNQKGTGRARHGSIRSPLWKGGGTTFGPRSERDFSKKVNKQMIKGALLSLLSKKAADGEVKVAETFEFDTHKTKQVASLMSAIVGGHSALVLASQENQNLHRGARNINRLKAMDPKNLNVQDLLTHRDVVFDKKALEQYAK